jgi:hypothetical protein
MLNLPFHNLKNPAADIENLPKGLSVNFKKNGL